jgi:hypothetical protein
MLLLGHAQTLACMIAGSTARSSSIRNSHSPSLSQSPRQCSFPSTTSGLYSIDIDNSVDNYADAARAMLFDDQHRALGEQAQEEGDILDPRMQEMKVAVASSSKTKRKNKRSTTNAGAGFGGGGKVKAKPASSSSIKLSASTKALAKQVEQNGVVLVPGVLTKETAAACREAVVTEVELMRQAIRQDPSLSVSLFYVPADIHFSTPRGYVLLPLRDYVVEESSTTETTPCSSNGPLVRATRELLQPGAVLSDLFGTLCDGGNSQLYDFCALRTEPGADRQVVHSDTPFQETPGLFTCFIALQDVTFEMGGTMFFPGTHVQTAERKLFDAGHEDKDAMLEASKPQYTMLKSGDAALFDMRTLHAGLANQAEGGAERLLLNFNFRNLKATGSLGHKPNLRPGYVGRYTLSTLQDELASEFPFADAGNGLLPGIGEGVLL